ncbi:hypothetical protein K2Y00_00020 [Patescibacteria group bacterium]|nr:hypothetical protein [Patescibacteria group bacterium]
MLLRIYFPPEFLGKVLGTSAHALEIIEIFSRDPFKNLSHAWHRDGCKAVSRTGVIEVTRKEPHEFASLGLTRPRRFLCTSEEVTYVLHNDIP